MLELHIPQESPSQNVAEQNSAGAELVAKVCTEWCIDNPARSQEQLAEILRYRLPP